MRRYMVQRNFDTKTVSQLINSLETDNKDVDAILEAARLQRIEQKERSKNRLRMVGILSLTIIMITIIICAYLADALLLGIPTAMVLPVLVAMFCCDF